MIKDRFCVSVNYSKKKLVRLYKYVGVQGSPNKQCIIILLQVIDGMDYTISQIYDTAFPMESISRKMHDLNVNSTGDSNFHLVNSQNEINCDRGLCDNSKFTSQVSSDFVELLKSNLSNFSPLCYHRSKYRNFFLACKSLTYHLFPNYFMFWDVFTHIQYKRKSCLVSPLITRFCINSSKCSPVLHLNVQIALINIEVYQLLSATNLM